MTAAVVVWTPVAVPLMPDVVVWTLWAVPFVAVVVTVLNVDGNALVMWAVPLWLAVEELMVACGLLVT